MADQDEGSRTLRAALAVYFEVNGFGPDGGYTASWVTGKFGPIPFAFPNFEARVRAVRFHDLHHVVTGYQTDGPGEGEISAWEIGSGCADYWAAWLLNLGGMPAGCLLAPGRVFRAFVRGRHSANLYRHEYDSELLATSVDEIRQQLLSGETISATTGDRLSFGLWLAVGVSAGLAQLGLVLALLTSLVSWIL